MIYTKICEVCGKEFQTTCKHAKRCSTVHIFTCPNCNQTVEYKGVTPFKMCKKCTSKAAAQKRKETMMKRYGAPTTLQCKELREKGQKTLLDKYGVDNPMKVESVQKKAKQTNLDKYGAENVMQNSDIAKRSANNRVTTYEESLAKARQTWMQKYGVDNPSKAPEVIKKMDETFMKRYGVKRAMSVPEFREKFEHTMEEKYGVPYYTMTDDYLSNSHIRVSQINKQFGELLDHTHIPYEYEFRIDMKYYDLHILDTNILIEIDPTYTHNVIGNHWSQVGLDKYYHRDKSKIAKESGFRCIHVFDWDSWDKVIDIIKPKKTIGARKCKIYKLNSKTTDEFLNKYHLQGTCKGQVLSLGLVYEDQLLEIMTFGKSRYNKNYDIELLRLCTHPDYVVTGGASKLFKFAVQQYELNSIISYCDASKFSGSVYANIGMKFLRNTPPQEIWSDCNYGKITANLLRQRGFDQLFGTNYGKGTDNNELMIEHGWLPVYDCGQKVFVYEA